MSSKREEPPVPDQPIKSEAGFFLRIKRNLMINFKARRPEPKPKGQPSKSQNGGSK
ncbi:MAG: hypothetical protein KME60_09790 [Cyanomargarita calcarea GSE-NOS-MK-12-04C]|jgi:hypothetical protein|uniref:Uncharacterized protein n=1 Tax=Cyanomargarita calcarea GSE-NOS-MK-12-04C TaxID=2839659 RepID=A0A951UUD0_9CYAN|nr:hypothetical protein [Cyanomargarita calcarea GSE-NOS-MK-12-04C]